MTREYSRWSPEEDEQLLFLREHVKLSFGQLDGLLKRKKDAARGRYLVLRPKPYRVAVSPEERRTKNVVQLETARAQRIAAQVAARASTLVRPLAADFFGDPPPGRSALDKITRGRMEHLGVVAP
jgi:hypothetical protein